MKPLFHFQWYQNCYTNTIKEFGIIKNQVGKLIPIYSREKVLFEVFNFKNGLDHFSDGLFKIKKNEKIGFANKPRNVVISLQ